MAPDRVVLSEEARMARRAEVGARSARAWATGAAAVAAAVLVLVGCGGKLLDPTGSATTAPAEDLVSLRSTGGIAGIDDRLIVSRRGQVRFRGTHPPRERTGTIPPGDLTRLQASLAKVDVGRLPRPRPPEGADLIGHTLVYGRHVVALEPGEDPPALAAVLRQLGALWAELSR